MKRKIMLGVLGLLVSSTYLSHNVKAFGDEDGIMTNGELSKWTKNHNSRIEAVEGISARNRLRVTELEKNQQDVAEVKIKSESNESRIGNLEKNKLDISEIEKRSIRNESSVNSNSKKIITTNDKLDTHINKYEDALDRLKKKNDEEDKHLVENDHKIEADEKDIAKHEKRLDTDEKIIADHTKKIEADEKQLQEQDKAIFKVVGGTYATNSQPVKVNKIDDNTGRIVKLENRAVDPSGIEKNKTSITNNEGRIKINESKITNNMNSIADNSEEIDNNSERISTLDSKVDGLEGEMNKGFAMSAAMASVDFQTVKVGNVGVGVGIGNYQDSQAISIGVGMRPSDNTTVNVKGAMSTGSNQESMVGAGATYQFNIFGS